MGVICFALGYESLVLYVTVCAMNWVLTRQAGGIAMVGHVFLWCGFCFVMWVGLFCHVWVGLSFVFTAMVGWFAPQKAIRFISRGVCVESCPVPSMRSSSCHSSTGNVIEFVYYSTGHHIGNSYVGPNPNPFVL